VFGLVRGVWDPTLGGGCWGEFLGGGGEHATIKILKMRTIK